MLDGALLLLGNPAALWMLLAGTLVGLVFGVLPGISGRTGLIVVAPLMIGMDPLLGTVFLLALHSIVHTSGSIPAILVGIPTSSAEAATVLDGYALTRRNRADLALGVSLAASALGGCLGAAALVAMIHVFRPIIAAIGQPEVLVLSLTGLAMIASLSGTRVAAGVAAAALGVLAGCVGLDPASGTPRFVLGMLELWDGLDIPAVVTGLFVIPELLAPSGGAAASRGAVPLRRMRMRGVVLGMAAVTRRWALLLRTSLIGIVVGLVPGMGAAIAVWLAYGHAVQTSPSRVPYGRGALAGVLAPEAANNSKEGGALAPTLFLGIPGSSSMAIMIAAFAGMGIRPGSHFLQTQAPFTHALALTIVIANLVAVPICLAGAPLLAWIALRARRAIPILAVCAAVASAVYASPFVSTLLQLAAFGALGCAMRQAGWPRPPLVLGFVVGPVAEGALMKTTALYGFDALLRPGVVIGVLCIVAALAYGWRRQAAAAATDPAERRWDLGLGLVVAAIGIGAFAVARGLPAIAATLPLAAASVLTAVAVLDLLRLSHRARAPTGGTPPPTHGAVAVMSTCGALLLVAAVAGLPLACGATTLAWLWTRERLGHWQAVAIAGATATVMFLCLKLADTRPPLIWGWLFARST
ncbi:MAG: tripartite tricarboxylate transporter permease [Alphaproteobacteria bacterium]|nr:tripartite tricarboxylate transporter permease [Alphaproteobacteria bacterium]